jgi:hypothetical protein
MSAFRQLRQLLPTVPSRLLDVIDGWVARLHGPHDLHGDGSVAICWLCDVEWPCESAGEAIERMAERRSRYEDRR